MKTKIRKSSISVLIIFCLMFSCIGDRVTAWADDDKFIIAEDVQGEAAAEGAGIRRESPELEKDISEYIGSGAVAAVYRAEKEDSPDAILANPRTRSADPLEGGQLEFQNIYSAQMNGEIRITGNTLRMPDTRYYKETLIEAYGKAGLPFRGNSQNNNLYMGEVDMDSDPQTRNSSAAGISLNAGASIEKAFLIWGGTSKPGNKTNDSGKMAGSVPQETPREASEDEVNRGPVIKFKTPKMDSYTVVVPELSNRISVYRKDYTACADVTQLVQEGGEGIYWAGDLPISTGYDVYGGWALVVVYRDDSCPFNDLNVFFGHRVIDRTTVAEVYIKDLITPPAGPVHSSIGMVIWESDQAGTGDYIEIAKDGSSEHRRIKDDLNLDTNIASSAVTYKGRLVEDRIPDYVNTHGMDAKVIELTDYMENNQNALHIRAGSAGDVYYPTIFTAEIELYKPYVKVTKTARNVSRPYAAKAMNGDVIEYTVEMENTGYDTAVHTVASDVLPAGVDYIAGSVECEENGVWAARTDAAGDDEVIYSDMDRTLTFHVGTGGTHSAGGALTYRQKSGYRYRVAVNGSAETDMITNTIRVDYAGFGGDKSKGGSSSASCTIRTEAQTPSMEFLKEADKAYVSAGDVIVYTFTVKNTGNMILDRLTLDDPMEGLSKPVLDKTRLEPGESAAATAVYTVTQEDVDRGKVENTAAVTGIPLQQGSTPPVPVTETSTVIVPSLGKNFPVPPTPSNPSKPVDPPTPSNPSRPVDPPTPSNPSRPVDPPTPSNPSRPGTPPTPGTPPAPGASPTPGTPSAPGTSEKKSIPTRSSDPPRPDDTAKTDTPMGSNSPVGSGDPSGAEDSQNSKNPGTQSRSEQTHKVGHVPKTGDNVNMGFWRRMLSVSLMGLFALYGLDVYRRKRKREQ